VLFSHGGGTHKKAPAMTGRAHRLVTGGGFAVAAIDARGHGGRLDRRSGLALFDAFGSTEKALHANAGRHREVPRFEADSAVRFFARHLGRVGTSPA